MIASIVLGCKVSFTTNTTCTETKFKHSLSLYFKLCLECHRLRHEKEFQWMWNKNRRFTKPGSSALHYILWLCPVLRLNFIIIKPLALMASYSQCMKTSEDAEKRCCLLLAVGPGEAGSGQALCSAYSSCTSEQPASWSTLWGCGAFYYVREDFSFKYTERDVNLNKTLKGISCKKLMPGGPFWTQNAQIPCVKNNIAESIMLNYMCAHVVSALSTCKQSPAITHRYVHTRRHTYTESCNSNTHITSFCSLFPHHMLNRSK